MITSRRLYFFYFLQNFFIKNFSFTFRQEEYFFLIFLKKKVLNTVKLKITFFYKKFTKKTKRLNPPVMAGFMPMCIWKKSDF